MKATVTACLGDWVERTHGADVWNAVQVRSGTRISTIHQISDDQPDDLAFRLFHNTAAVLDIPLKQVYDGFGYHWMSYWMQTHFPSYVGGITSFRQLIGMLADIHDRVTQNVPNARPPQFTMVWSGPDSLDIEYRSERNLVDLFVSLVQGAIRYYGDAATVHVVEGNHVRVVWVSQPEPIAVAVAPAAAH